MFWPNNSVINAQNKNLEWVPGGKDTLMRERGFFKGIMEWFSFFPAAVVRHSLDGLSLGQMGDMD